MRLYISRQIMINTAFILLLSIFTSGFLWSFYLQKENNHNIDRFYRSTNWYANRMLYQSEKFLYKAELYQLGAIPLSDLTQSYRSRLEPSTTLFRSKHHRAFAQSSPTSH